MQCRHRFIVVEGPIGVGKTTLANRLTESFGGTPVLEQAELNPFLERFYRNPREAALSTQLHFLLQRAEQMRELGQPDLFERVRVADFLLAKDRVFAEVNLDADELRLYLQLYEHLTIEAPRPDLVIYLQAPVNVLRDRIERRGIDYERNMGGEYLQALCDAYTRLFHEYDEAPLLIVNAAEINLADREADYHALVEQIQRIDSGRHFFNPAPLALA